MARVTHRAMWLVVAAASFFGGARAPSSSSVTPADARAVFAPIRMARATEPQVLAGWIVDSVGQPIEGAEIWVDQGDGAFIPAGTTGDDGSFSLGRSQRQIARLRVSGPGVVTADVAWPGGDQPLRVRATRSVALAATVTDSGGAPAAGAHVEIGTRGVELDSARTGSDGRVQFLGLPPGTYEVWAHTSGAATRLVRLPSDRGAAVLPLEPAHLIRSRLIDDTGNSLAGEIEIRALDRDHAVRRKRTNARGELELVALPGRWQLRATVPGRGEVTRVVQVIDKAVELDLPIGIGGIVTGTVVDTAGRPVAGATVLLRPEHRGISLPVTGARVHWVHPLAGKRKLPIRDSRRFGAARDGNRPAECERGHCGVDIGQKRGSIVHAATEGEVVVVARIDRGRAGRYVVIEHPAGLRTFYLHLDHIRADLAPGLPVRAGEPLATLGSSGIIRSAPHLHFAVSQKIEQRSWFIDPEPILERAIVLPSPASLDNAGGAPDALLAAPGDSGVSPTNGGVAPGVPGAAPGEVAAEPAPELELRAVTGPDGRFRTEGVTAGRYIADAFSGSLAPGHSAPFSVSPGARTELVVEVAAGVAMNGQVLDDLGPIAGARIVAEEGDGESARPVASAISDRTGRFALPPLSGAITLRASAAGHGTAERVVFAAPGRLADHSFVLERMGEDSTDDSAVDDAIPRAPLQLSIRDRHTRGPLSGVRVAAKGPAGASASAVSDRDGAITLPGLAVGRWKVRATRAGYAAVTRTVGLDGPRDAVAMELSRGASLSGVVRDRDGQRVAGVRIECGSAKAESDRDGRFRLADAPTGAIEIRAHHRDESGQLRLELAPGDELVTLEITLD